MSDTKIPTLYYFKVRGRGMFIRAICTYLDIKFENHYVSEDEFLKMKDTLPNGQIPLWIDEDIQLVQSGTIARYIAEKNNFAGFDLFEKAKANEIIDSLWDCINLIWNNQKDETKKNELLKSGKIIKILTSLENRILATDNRFREFSMINYADISTAVAFDYICWKGMEYIGNDINLFPKLEKMKNHFLNTPKLKEFYSNLPNSEN